ncbi:MAG: biopolymer transporter ExbD [Bacteroidetes bacterium]|nr:biopolymer transporter ExbD [Bacteroidota bacterium]
MAKFTKKAFTSQEIPTSALPDIIFILLFFFMVTTVLRETELLVKQKLPHATQIQKLERKSLVSYIYIGKPNNPAFGSEPRIQVNDVLIEPRDIPRFIAEQKDKLSEAERDQITISIKVDKDAKMGIVSDVKQQLREANARKLNYAAIKKAVR